MIFDNAALNVDYSKFDYDLVFTSPPYYFIQKYENNKEYVCQKKKMDDCILYIPLFSNTYANLKPNGIYALNINKEVYENVCVKLFGPAHDSYPYTKITNVRIITTKLFMFGKNNCDKQTNQNRLILNISNKHHPILSLRLHLQSHATVHRCNLRTVANIYVVVVDVVVDVVDAAAFVSG